jgi:hypothetical protein
MSFTAMRSFFVACCALLAVATVVRSETWTGAANSLWANQNNWDTITVPGSSGTALFNGAGNGNTTISLGGGTQPINTVRFDTASAAAYGIGQDANDILSFDSGGFLETTSSLTKSQTINATLLMNGGLLAINSVPNGATTGNGLVGLALGPIKLNGEFEIIQGAANVTTLLNGTISDAPSQTGSLKLNAPTSGAANNSNFVLNGANTYTGGTTITANTGTNGAIYLGSDSAFGTGKIHVVDNGNNPEIRSSGGTRTISNAIDLDRGTVFAGTDNIVLNGPVTISSSTSRTIFSKITGATSALVLGATPGSSNIYLGNPSTAFASTAVISPGVSGSTTFFGNIVVNALFQDVNASDPNSAVQYSGNGQSGSNRSIVIINSQQTYASPTRLGGGSSFVEFNQDSVVDGSGNIISGPFGKGLLIANSSSNSQLAPLDASHAGTRTIANPLRMDFGFTVVNESGDTTGVTFTGPITYNGCFGSLSSTGVSCGTSTGRLIQQLMGANGGTLTLGSASSPSTLTLAIDVTGKTLTFAGNGKTIVNDAIADGNSNITPILVTNSSTTTFNGNMNTAGDFSVTGTNSTVIINGTRSGAGAMAVSGSNAKLYVNGSKTGSGAVTVTAGTLGGTGSISGDVTNNGKIAPGVSGVGTLTLNNNLALGTNGRLLIDLSSASADKLIVGGNLNLSNTDFLDVTGTGAGPTWVIATYGGTLTGTFDNITSGYYANYGSGSNSQITLSLAGDWNKDGKVDAGDYVAWRKNPAANGGDPAGYNLWRANFGNSVGSGSGTNLGGQTTVPEPASIVFVLLGAIGCTLRRSQRRDC